MRKLPKWLRLHDPGPPQMWRIGYALAACFLIALAGLAALWAAAWALLGNPPRAIPPKGGISVHDTVGVAQLVFASVAGAGALVALVVAYRRQRVSEASSAHDRTRVFNERFTTIAAQLGDAQPAVRLAGVHAMAGLADDWTENQQTCIDVLCAYLRLPYDPDPGDSAAAADRGAYRANREVRHTIIRLIGTHLREGAAVSWQGLDLDFTGVVFDGGDFHGAMFSAGIVRFGGANFSGGTVDFSGAEFAGGEVSFYEATFSGSEVAFHEAKFSGGQVNLGGVSISDGTVNFGHAQVSGGQVNFGHAQISGGTVNFGHAQVSGGTVRFFQATLSGGEVGFEDAEFSGGTVRFVGVQFSGGTVTFRNARFSGGEVMFHAARFSGGQVSFDNAEFSSGTVSFGIAPSLFFTEFSGAMVSFNNAEFSGGTVNFEPVTFSGGTVTFRNAQVSGGTVNLGAVSFSGGTVDFSGARFSGGEVSFRYASFSGGQVSFDRARFSGTAVDFTGALDWSHPPKFAWEGAPPTGVKLPAPEATS